MGWMAKTLGRFNRNGDMVQQLFYCNGEQTVPVMALLGSDGDILAPATAANQVAANALMANMTSNIAATLETRVKAGNAYIASVGKSTLALGLLNLKATIENPAGSGKAIYVYALEVAQDGAALIWPSLQLNPATNKPSSTTGTSKFNQNPSSVNTSVALIKSAVEAVAMAGGIDLGVIPLPTGRQVYRDHIYVLTPGTMLGMNVSSAVGLNGMIRAFYWEEPV